MDELWTDVVRVNVLTPAFWITAAVICVAVLAFIFIMMYKKKKRQQIIEQTYTK